MCFLQEHGQCEPVPSGADVAPATSFGGVSEEEDCRPAAVVLQIRDRFPEVPLPGSGYSATRPNSCAGIRQPASGNCGFNSGEHGDADVSQLFRSERKEQPGHPHVPVTYRFAGPVDEIYATLVVRLHHTVAFESTELWKPAAYVRTQTGAALGFTLTREGEGAPRLEVYFAAALDENSRVLFLRARPAIGNRRLIRRCW